MHEFLSKIEQHYLEESKQPFQKNWLAEYVRKTPRETFYDELDINENDYICTGSVGQGNWATIPWVAILNKESTVSATRGYYLVFLFAADMSGVYLSLNQGWTYYEREYKRHKGLQEIEKISHTWRGILGELQSNPHYAQEIDLKAPVSCTSKTLIRGYEKGHILGLYYNFSALPEDNTLLSDIQEMLRKYNDLLNLLRDINQGISVDAMQLSNEYEFPEGRRKQRLHFNCERNKRLVDSAKNLYAQKCKDFCCEICGFSFAKKYGELGKNYIEAHHIKPLSELDETTHTKISDLLMVCSNCHAMLHRKRPWVSREELALLLK